MKTLTTSRIAALISCTVLLVAAGTKVIKGYTTEDCKGQKNTPTQTAAPQQQAPQQAPTTTTP